MQDEKIVGLLNSRDEKAISEIRGKYGRYLQKIAYNILGDIRDCEECLGDVFLGAWNSIPPNSPQDLRAYLVMLTRRCSLSMLRKRFREKRRGTEYAVSLDELADCIPGGSSPESETDVRLLGEVINSWLSGLPEEQRKAFVGRYYFSDSVRDISKYLGFSESKVKTLLYRARLSLKERLEKECII